MNPRQRRGAALMILASVGAVAVFLAILGYVGSVNAQVGDYRNVLQLKKNVDAYRGVTKSMVTVKQVPKKWLGDGHFLSKPSQLDGLVAVKDLSKNSYLNDGMLVEAPKLGAGQREIAILIDAETGVAGKVKPGARVDVYATYNSTSDANNQPCAVRILANTQVVDVGQLQRKLKGGGQGVALGQVVPVTFALSPKASLELTHAEAVASKLRLALVGPGSPKGAEGERVCEPPSTDETPTEGDEPGDTDDSGSTAQPGNRSGRD